MRQCLFVGEVIGITLHRQSETLGKNIIPCGRRFLGAFHIKLISLVTYRLSDVRVCLHPHLRIADLVDRVELVPPDRNMRVWIIPFENAHKLHFDGIAGAVTNSTLRTGGHDQIVVHLGSALLDSADNILANVAGEPLVYGCDLASKTLQLVDRHGADLNKRAGQKVLNAFLCRSQLDAVGLRTGRVLERALGQKLEYGATGSCDGSADW